MTCLKKIISEQAISAEKESLLMELHQVNEATSLAVSQLQTENKQLAKDINDLDKQLQGASNEKTELIQSFQKEKVIC